MMGEILFLAHRAPYPPDRGDRIRSYHLVKALAALAPVHVVAFADDDDDAAAAEGLRPMVASLATVVRTRGRLEGGLAALAKGQPVSVAMFDDDAIRAAVDRLLIERPIDTLFVFSGQMATYVPRDLGGRRFIMDFVDVDSAKFAAYAADAKAPMRWIHAREARLLARFERAVAAQADTSLFVSEAEAALFRAGAPGVRIEPIENGIDLAGFDPAQLWPKPPIDTPFLLFTGQMDYAPNIEAVEAFACGPFALIRTARPDVRFVIAGRAPTRSVQRLADLPGVVVTGAVPDMRPWLAHAAAVVAPLLTARGIQNKVLEAMAMARPVVASPAAHEGIDALDGRDLIVCPLERMAPAIVGLLSDPDRATAIGRAARARMVARYGWDARLAGLPALIGREPAAIGAAA
ncbi:TIGR03087 family PEP-CTERM/XrtA system glycosyltransferase [Sphingomonas sp. 1P06PA]|uniref:TIGR03087 family PEP-CTERM/XrtA system glycosyltransferase n=1 Tax=Sphingomonas sp. 1P06PA TaxID=554121 RepID=UPI0039A654D3